ncbi:MAG: SurA N-terminal domain-containing protein [Puniceicoccales bacterium]|jgi:peptidyl-prolyl cis-trans isomerase D|nr:SurA N-terminal domain-containing protein [Puniceicoccales bacterium]
MISFLQRILQKHHKWLFSILLFVIVVSFVFTIGASPGIGTGRKRAKQENFFDYKLDSERDRNALFQETWISAMLQQTPIFFEAQLQNLAITRAMELYYAKELRLPDPSEAQLKEKIQQMPLFFSKKTQAFDPAIYEKILQGLLGNPRITPAVVQKALSDDWKIAFVRDALGRQGYAFISQAKEALAKAETQYTFDLLSFSPSPDEDEDIEVSEEDIHHYVAQHSEAYLEPESYRLAFIEFNPEQYRPSIPVATKELLKKFYFDHKADFASLEEGSDELKQAIIESYERSQSLAIATQKASDLAYQVYEQELTPEHDALKALLEQYEVKLETLPIFRPGKYIDDERFSPDSLSIATTLDEERAFSDPIKMKNGSIAILVLQETILPHLADFEDIRETALADLQKERRREHFRQQCEGISKALSAIPEPHNREDFEERTQAMGLSLKTFSQLKLKDAHGKISSAVSQVLPTLSEGKYSTDLFQENRCEWVRLISKDIDAAVITEERIQEQLTSLEQTAAQQRTEAFWMENIQNWAKRQPGHKDEKP